MAKGDFYFPLYYQRLLTSTVGWTDEQFGAYVKLLIYQFDQASIPADIKELSGIAPSVKKHWPKISKKFQDDGKGGLINQVMDEIRVDIQGKKETNKENGKLGGRPKTKRISETKPNGNQTVSKNETEKEPIPISNNQYPNERENSPHVVLKPIEECLTIAMAHSRWVKDCNATREQLEQFNQLLAKRGEYDKNPLDYKKHFSNWKFSGKMSEHNTTTQTQEPTMTARERRDMEELSKYQ